jgi:putative membrane-bound dehydrogenase-like protein
MKIRHVQIAAHGLFLFACALPGLVCADTNLVPPSLFTLSDSSLRVSVWAASPMLRNPVNMDFDKDGRIWVAEGVNYRKFYDRQPEGDRIVILEDTNGDGTADTSSVFVQEPFLRCPMGLAVIDNKVVVSMAPDIVVYTDVNRDRKFDPAVDQREVLLHGFNGRVHDHTVHSVTVGPDGQWYWNSGNCGAVFTDRSGKTFRIGSAYDPYYGRKDAGELGWDPREIAGLKSDDGHVWIGGFAARMNPDGSGVRIIGHNFRNSYEQTVTSFGDIFQTDNDDPPACRTTFLLEGGNAGFCSFDGKRAWQADRRPGQSTGVAEWRQEDPGTMPAGDVYGGGSPTGVAFVEDSALGSKYRGLLLAAEPARNTIFGYFPKPEGAGFKLERFDLLTSNVEKKFAGADFSGGGGSVTNDQRTLFRPSDVAVGPDGAIYVADFFDQRVGGHQVLDDSSLGAIYRVAPKGFKPRVPKTDLSTLDGAIAALKNPAVNVRGAAFSVVKAHGEKAIKPLAKLLKDGNPYIRARAVWLLSQLGRDGVKLVGPLLEQRDEEMRVVAWRALRREIESNNAQRGETVPALAARLVNDPSPAVRRELALAMRDVPWAQAKDVLVPLAKKFDGRDRTYLEALGTGAKGKEGALFDALAPADSAGATNWPASFAGIAWRLHPPQSAASFIERALAGSLPEKDRRAAVTALAYIGTAEAVQGIVEVAARTEKLTKADAVWWLLNRKDDAWKAHGLDAALKSRKIYDPDAIELQASAMPAPIDDFKGPSKSDVLALRGDATRGRGAFGSRCAMCHRVGTEGNDVGPDLSTFGRTQTREVLVQSILEPSADIAHGFGGHAIVTKDNLTIEGVIVSDGNPVIITAAGGLTQMVPPARIKSKKALTRSLMWTPDVLGVTAQDAADLVAYLKSL